MPSRQGNVMSLRVISLDYKIQVTFNCIFRWLSSVINFVQLLFQISGWIMWNLSSITEPRRSSQGSMLELPKHWSWLTVRSSCRCMEICKLAFCNCFVLNKNNNFKQHTHFSSKKYAGVLMACMGNFIYIMIIHTPQNLIIYRHNFNLVTVSSSFLQPWNNSVFYSIFIRTPNNHFQHNPHCL